HGTLVARDLEGLRNIVKQEEQCTKELADAEKKRLDAQQQLLAPHEPITLLEYAERANDAQLTGKLEELQHVIRDLQQKNETNEELVQDGLDYVQFVVRQMTAARQPNYNYGSQPNQAPQPGGPGFFDQKA